MFKYYTDPVIIKSTQEYFLNPETINPFIPLLWNYVYETMLK